MYISFSWCRVSAHEKNNREAIGSEDSFNNKALLTPLDLSGYQFCSLVKFQRARAHESGMGMVMSAMFVMLVEDNSTSLG